MKTYEIIYKPAQTEKTTLLQEKNVYVFWVNPKATKVDIKNAIKQIYGADVQTVRVTQSPSKERRIKYGTMTKRPTQKKAYITLAKRAKLDVTKLEKEVKENKLKTTKKAAAAKKDTKKAKTTSKSK